MKNIKEEIESNTVIVGDFNTTLTSMDRSSRQKINKETTALNDILDQVDLTDVFRAFHPKAAEYTFFSTAHGMFSKTDHKLGYEISLNKFKKIEIISSILSDHNAMTLEINHKKKTEKYTKIWKLNNNNEIKEEIKRHLERNKNENTTVKNLWDTVKAILRGKFIALQAYLKINNNNKRRKSSNKQSNFILKGT